MSEANNPVQGFLGNLKDKAQDLAENIGNKVESVADKVVGEQNVDKIKDVLKTDLGEVAHDALGAVKEKGEDLAEGAEKVADRVLGEERVDKVKSFFNKDASESKDETPEA